MSSPTTSVNLTARPLAPAPEVPADELGLRLKNIRACMSDRDVDIIVLTDKKNVEYLTNYQTLSWAYNARPVFVVVSHNELFMVASLTDAGNIESKKRGFEFRCYDGYLAEAIAVIVDLISTIRPTGSSRIAIDYGQDMYGRGSLELIEKLQEVGKGSHVLSATDLLWRVRMIKSPFEAALKRTAFEIVNSAFDQVISEAHLGITEYELCQRLQAQIFLNGAERSDPTAMLFSRGDFFYGRPPSERKLEIGHYIWTDFRATYGGYPADQNRTARAGDPEPWEIEAYTKTRNLTIKLIESIRAGITCGEVYETFETLWAHADLGKIYGLVSRIGHGGGLDVTEPPSISKGNPEIIRSGMILHIEPKLERDGAIFQFEEVIYVGEDNVEFLSVLSPESIPVVSRSAENPHPAKVAAEGPLDVR